LQKSPESIRRRHLVDRSRREAEAVSVAVARGGSEFATLLDRAGISPRRGPRPSEAQISPVAWGLTCDLADYARAKLRDKRPDRFALFSRSALDRWNADTHVFATASGAEIEVIGLLLGIPLTFAMSTDVRFRNDLFSAMICAHLPGMDAAIRDYALARLSEYAIAESKLWRYALGARMPWASCVAAFEYLGRSDSPAPKFNDLWIQACCGNVKLITNPRRDAATICSRCAMNRRGKWPPNAVMPGEVGIGWWLSCTRDGCGEIFEGRGSTRSCKRHR
jgi:hypothetical protein